MGEASARIPGLSARVALLFGFLAWLTGCGAPVGSACTITGSGFHAKDPCATKCLSRWAVNCPDDSRPLPGVCAGRSNCEPGSCPGGQACYSFDDPFEKRSYCVPDDVCGPLSSEQRLQWEHDSAVAAAELQAKYEARRALRENRPTLATEPAADPE